MPRGAAYILVLLIVLMLIAGDLLLLTSSAAVTQIARVELEKIFGDALRYDKMAASLDGVLTFRQVSYRLGGESVPFLSSERAEICCVATPLGQRPQRVVLDEPRLLINRPVLEHLSRGAGGKPLSKSLGPGALPAIECRNGYWMVQLPEVFSATSGQEFRIDSMLLLPFGEYGYAVRGEISHGMLGRWHVGGEVDLASGEVRLEIASYSLEWRDPIRALFPPRVQRAWDIWRPEGLCEAVVHVEGGGRRPVDVRVTLRPRDMSITHERFPYRVDHLEGEIDFFPDRFVVKHLRGVHGPCEVRATGTGGGYRKGAAFDIRLTVEGVRLDDELRAAFAEQTRKVYDLFSPSGTALARCRVQREEGPDKPVRVPTEILLRDVRFKYRGFPYEVRHAQGWIGITEDQVVIRGLTARDRGADITIDGVVRNILADSDVALTVEARGIPLDDRLMMALDRKTQKLWDDLAPEGRVDLSWCVLRRPGQEMVQEGTIRMRGENKAVYSRVPVPLTEIRGEVAYTKEKVILRHLSGRAREAEVELHGEVAAGGDVRLRFDAVGLKIDDKFASSMPAEVRKILDRVRLSGEGNLRGDFRVGKEETGYSLDLRLNKAKIDAAVPFEEVQGLVSLAGSFSEGKTEMLGHVNFSRARVAGKTVSDVMASLNSTGPVLRFGRIKASAYGGVLSGTMSVDTETGKYAGEFAVSGMSLREFTRETESYRDKAVSGDVSFEISDLRGEGSDLGAMTGKGSMVIRGGFLWEVPLFVNLWTINPQKIFTKRNQFEAGNVTFDIRDEKFVIRGLAFTSADASLVGRGAIGFDGALDLTLRAESGSLLGVKIPGMELLTTPFSLLSSSFLGVHVTGTFEKPESGLKMFPGLGGEK